MTPILPGGYAMPTEFPYRYAWNRMDRKDRRCAVLVRAVMNSALVVFEDGFTAVTSRNAIRKAMGRPVGQQLTSPEGK